MGCAGAEGPLGESRSETATGGWESELLRDHPLVGTVWDVRTGERIDEVELVRRARRARYLLLGEKHDNPDHHRLQAWILARVAEASRRPAVAFEMIGTESETALREHLEKNPRDAAGLGPAVRWEERGWPPWELYRPIAEVALNEGLEIVAANLSREEVRRISSEGPDVLPEDLRERTGLDESLEPELREELAEEVRAGHCGVLPESAIPAMVRVQRARDAQMADRMLEPARPDGAVLIAGSAHVVRTRGVPSILERRVPAGEILSVAFLEVIRGSDEPDLPSVDGEGRVRFDLVWYTPRMDESDPCERFKDHLERLRQSHTDDPPLD